MKEMIINIDKELSNEVESILDDIGLDADTVIKMVYNRIAKEGSILFLLSKKIESVGKIIESEQNIKNQSKMTKTLAKRLFMLKGHKIEGEITFASKNKTFDNYWANPDWVLLAEDWALILNDFNHKKLYLFQIPKNTFSKNNFEIRSDRKSKLNIQIMYNDPTFTDNRSNVSFIDYLVETIDY